MTDVKKRNEPHTDRNALVLLAVALFFGGLAVAADVMWMAPHASSTPVVAGGSAAAPGPAQATSEPSDYFPSHFTLQTKDADETAAPTF